MRTAGDSRDPHAPHAPIAGTLAGPPEVSMAHIPAVLRAVAVTAGLALSTSPATSGQDLLSEAAQEAAWMRLVEEQGLSHASGHRPELGPVILGILGNPTTAVGALRVGLHYSYTPAGAFSEFASLHHPAVSVSNTAGTVDVMDLATGRVVGIMQPGDVFAVSFDGTSYVVVGPKGERTEVSGPLRFSPRSPENLFRIESIERANVLATGRVRPLYRGALEVSRGPSTPAGRVNLVNVLDLEDYLRGVVANESPAFFHLEALKSQATAARGYAVANVGRYERLGYPFDLVDSSASQVYRGVLSEHARAVEATEATRGLVVSHDGRIITAFYSSSFGGHSDSVEWIFNSPSAQLPGANVTPYLTGIYDGEPPAPDLDTGEGRQAFWSAPQPQTFDACERVGNRFARWRIEIPAEVIRARLPGRCVVLSGDLGGDVTEVAAVQRMSGSGRIAAARITLTTGAAEVRGWDNLRRVLGTPAVATPVPPGCSSGTIAAGFVLNTPTLIEPYLDTDGDFGGVVAQGGGWGHNVGLSQYGAHGRGRAGQGFIEILKAYYSGVDVGTYPIDIGGECRMGRPALRQRFAAPSGHGTLEVRPSGLKRLRVRVNGTHTIVLNGAELEVELLRVDLTPYLAAGMNVIQYDPVGRGTATVSVVVD